MALALRLTSLARLGGAASSASRSRLISLTSLREKLVPYNLADIGEGIREVTVKEWFVKPGDKVSQFDQICEVQSDKASVTITSRYDGVIKKLYHELDQTCLVGSPLVDIEVEGQDDAVPAAPESQSTTPESPAAPAASPASDGLSESQSKAHDNKALTTPAVRKIAKENNVDLTKVPATGRDGRVLKEDILAYLGRIARKIEAEEPRMGSTSDVVESTINPLAGKKYAKHMWKSMTQSLTIPHFVYSDECDISKLVRLRSEVREAFKAQGISLSYMPFFIKAISRALLECPELNAVINENTETIDIKKEHNISLAMDTPGGLVVPNIKNVQNLSIIEIAKELNRLQELGRKSSLPPNDLMGGTFSISNVGIIGGTYTKPVILSPQVVIGAIGKIQRLPRFDEQDNVIAANILTISWAADHRVVDGVTMAKFSNSWKYYVENPSHLILGV